MVKHCAIDNCNSGTYGDVKKRKKKKMRQTSLFSVPRDADRRQKWIQALEQDLKIGQYVCEFHFKPDDIIKADPFIINQEIVTIDRIYRKLKKEAIPLTKDVSQHYQQELETREFLIKSHKKKLRKPQVVSANQDEPLQHRIERKQVRGSFQQQNITDCEMGEMVSADLPGDSSVLTLNYIADNFKIPPYWAMFPSTSSISYIYFDPINRMPKFEVQLTIDLKVMVSFFGRSEISWKGQKVQSLEHLTSILCDIQTVNYCSGTGLSQHAFSEKCVGIIEDISINQRRAQFLRCIECRQQRRKIQMKNINRQHRLKALKRNGTQQQLDTLRKKCIRLRITEKVLEMRT